MVFRRILAALISAAATLMRFDLSSQVKVLFLFDHAIGGLKIYVF